jgi:hypothetical protein
MIGLPDLQQPGLKSAIIMVAPKTKRTQRAGWMRH